MTKINFKTLTEMVISVNEWECNFPFTFEVNNKLYKVTISDISEEIDTNNVFSLSPCIINNNNKVIFIWNEDMENEYIIKKLKDLCANNDIILHDEYENHLCSKGQIFDVKNIEQLEYNVLQIIKNV